MEMCMFTFWISFAEHHQEFSQQEVLYRKDHSEVTIATIRVSYSYRDVGFILDGQTFESKSFCQMTR